jgi:hypothetical protein
VLEGFDGIGEGSIRKYDLVLGYHAFQRLDVTIPERNIERIVGNELEHSINTPGPMLLKYAREGGIAKTKVCGIIERSDRVSVI